MAPMASMVASRASVVASTALDGFDGGGAVGVAESDGSRARKR